MKKITVPVLLAFISGCGLQYQPMTDKTPHDGYSHEKLADGTLKVSFETWRAADPEALCELALQRAEELVEGPWKELSRSSTTYAEYVQVPAFRPPVPFNTGMDFYETRSETITPAYAREQQIKRCDVFVKPLANS